MCVLAAGCGFTAVITPWVVRNYVVLHRFLPITSGAGSLYMVTRPVSVGPFDGQGVKEWFALSNDERSASPKAMC